MSRLIFGIHPIKERLKRANPGIRMLWVDRNRVERDAQFKELMNKLPEDTIVERVEKDDLDRIAASASHQGLIASVGDYEYVALEDLIENQDRILLLVVDGVTDPQNLGAMLRSAAVFGATGVVLTKDRCAAINNTVMRISSGASEHLPVAKVTNLSRAIKTLKEAGVWVIGTVEADGERLSTIDLTIPSALVLGSEGKGMRPNIRKHCDALITLPTPGPIPALNVAAATAVVFYEAARQSDILNK